MFNLSKTSPHGVRQLMTRPSWWQLLTATVFLLVAMPIHATPTDDRYFQIYSEIDKADELSKAGQMDRAKEKYQSATKRLRELKRVYPNYNPKLVASRLEYLANRLEELSRPPVPIEAEVSEPTVVSKTPKVGESQIKLLEAGAEPRTVLRMQAQAGESQKVKIVIRMKMAVIAAEVSGGDTTLPPMTLGATITTKNVSPDGMVTYEVLLNETDVLKEDGAMEQMIEAMKAQLDPMKGLVLTGTMTDRYLTTKMDAKVPPGTSSQARESMEQMKDAFGNKEFVLPEEAVGVGAKWEVKRKDKSQGMTIDEVIRHEIISKEGDVLVVRSVTTQSAANQKIPNPIMPTLKVDMTKMSGSATETVTIDLTKPFPVKAKADNRTEVVMTTNTAGKRQTMTMKTEVNSTLESE